MPRSKDHLPLSQGYERDEGFVRVWREIFTCYGRLIPPPAVAIWAFLRDHVHRKQDAGGGLVWVGYRKIQATFEIVDRETVKGYIEALERVGLIRRRPASVAVPDLRDRFDLGMNELSVVYTVNDPPPAEIFARLTFGRYCVTCMYAAKCAGREIAGLEKIPGIHTEGEALPVGGRKIRPWVVGKSDHNKSIVVVSGDLPTRLQALGVRQTTQMKLVAKYGAAYVLQKVELAEAQIETIEKPAAWLVAACRDDYLPEPGLRGQKPTNRRTVKPPEIRKVYR